MRLEPVYISRGPTSAGPESDARKEISRVYRATIAALTALGHGVVAPALRSTTSRSAVAPLLPLDDPEATPSDYADAVAAGVPAADDRVVVAQSSARSSVRSQATGRPWPASSSSRQRSPARARRPARGGRTPHAARRGRRLARTPRPDEGLGGRGLRRRLPLRRRSQGGLLEGSGLVLGSARSSFADVRERRCATTTLQATKLGELDVRPARYLSLDTLEIWERRQ